MPIIPSHFIIVDKNENKSNVIHDGGTSGPTLMSHGQQFVRSLLDLLLVVEGSHNVDHLLVL